MKNFENDTSYLRYLNEIFRHCERMFSKAKFWISQQKVKLIKNYGNFCRKTYKWYEKCSNLILGEKIKVCERADIPDLWGIDLTSKSECFRKLLKAHLFVAVHPCLCVLTTRWHLCLVSENVKDLPWLSEWHIHPLLWRYQFMFRKKNITKIVKWPSLWFFSNTSQIQGNFFYWTEVPPSGVHK